MAKPKIRSRATICNALSILVITPCEAKIIYYDPYQLLLHNLSVYTKLLLCVQESMFFYNYVCMHVGVE